MFPPVAEVKLMLNHPAAFERAKATIAAGEKADPANAELLDPDEADLF